jgi:hypothetical protein
MLRLGTAGDIDDRCEGDGELGAIAIEDRLAGYFDVTLRRYRMLGTAILEGLNNLIAENRLETSGPRFQRSQMLSEQRQGGGVPCFNGDRNRRGLRKPRRFSITRNETSNDEAITSLSGVADSGITRVADAYEGVRGAFGENGITCS